MSRRDDEHDVLMKLGQDTTLLRQVAEDNRIDGYTHENPGREVRVAVEEASDELRERLDRFQDTAEDVENALESIAESHEEAAESLDEISGHTSYLPAINENAYVTATGVNYLCELGERSIDEQVETNTTLSIMAGHTEELPEIRSRLGTLNKIAGTHLGVAAVGVVAQVRQLKVLEKIGEDIVEGLEDVEDAIEDNTEAIYELNDDINEGFENVVEGLEDVEDAIEKNTKMVEVAGKRIEGAVEDNTRMVEVAGKRIERQIAVSAAASAQRIAEHLDYQTAVVSDRLAYIAQVSDTNRQAVVAAIEQFSADEERRKQEVVTAIQSGQENNAESKFRNALMHLSLGRYGAAINTLAEVFKYQDTHAPAWMFFGDCCWRLGQSDEARNAYYLASQYALLAKRAVHDTLAMKNKDVFEKSLARLSRLEALLGNDKYARKVLVDGQKAWGKPRHLYRIRYELIRLEIKADPKSGKKEAGTLVSIAKKIPEVREEISTSSIFKFARRARRSLRYGNGPLVELAEVLDFFDTQPVLQNSLASCNPQNGYRQYVYGQLYRRIHKDLASMTGNCMEPTDKHQEKKFSDLAEIQKKLVELKQEFDRARLYFIKKYKDAERDEAIEYASWTVLTKLHLMIWADGFASEYLGWTKSLKWERGLYESEQQQPYSSRIQDQLKKVSDGLNQLGFYKRTGLINTGILPGDLSIIDGKFESIGSVGTVFVPDPYYFLSVPMLIIRFPYAIPISPWWEPELGIHQSVVMFTPVSRDEAERVLDGLALCAPLDPDYLTPKVHGSFERDRVIKISLRPSRLNYIQDGIEKERDIWIGIYHGQKVYNLSDKSPYDSPDDIGRLINVRVAFFNFNELRVVEVVGGFKTT